MPMGVTQDAREVDVVEKNSMIDGVDNQHQACDFSNQTLNNLSDNLDGTLIMHNAASSKPTYPSVWNALLKSPTPAITLGTPTAYVLCKTKQDVITAVQYAVTHKMALSAKGTGHHYGGVSLRNGSLILDMSQLQSISIDPEARTATIGPGVTTRQLEEATIKHGLHFPGGHISHVGLAGFILGGGHGWGVTEWGAAADNVLGFEVLLPNLEDAGQQPQLQYVTSQSDPELFAGLKGAGAFLAIVTEFRLQLHPVPSQLPCLTAIYPVSASVQVARLYKQLSLTAPASVEISLCLVRSDDPPHNPLVILGAVGFEEANSAAVQQTYDQIRAFLPSQRVFLDDSCKPYLEALSMLDAAWTWPNLCLYGHGMFIQMTSLTDELVQELVCATENMTSHHSMILFAPNAPHTDQPSSVDFRDGLFLSAYAMWPRTAAGPDTDKDLQHVAWVKRVEAAVGDAAVGLYINEVMHDDPGQLQKCYKPETLTKLLKLKTHTDPFGLLHALPVLQQ